MSKYIVELFQCKVIKKVFRENDPKVIFVKINIIFKLHYWSVNLLYVGSPTREYKF